MKLNLAYKGMDQHINKGGSTMFTSKSVQYKTSFDDEDGNHGKEFDELLNISRSTSCPQVIESVSKNVIQIL